MRTLAVTTGARPFNAPLRLLPKRSGRKYRRLVWTLDHGSEVFFLEVPQPLASFRADAMIDFKRPVSSYFDFTFWAFPVSTWPRSAGVPRFLRAVSSGKPAFGRRCPPEVTSSGGRFRCPVVFRRRGHLHAGHGELVGRRAGSAGRRNEPRVQ